ncbi:hypothetical protein RN001_004279 [Aquatica leii]|uniref:Uncharacterized protein n=1 Tax=Aquatica leii TaxID=1421715 RepID=A0AAN7P551_9COLE|nr:hypothetical protein RN001_004279 [Aquatica leii]
MTDPYIINKYFDILEQTLTDLSLHEKPNQIWNLYESSFCHDPNKTKIVGAKGKACSRTVSGPGKENTTVVASINHLSCHISDPICIHTGKIFESSKVSKSNISKSEELCSSKKFS